MVDSRFQLTFNSHSNFHGFLTKPYEILISCIFKNEMKSKLEMRIECEWKTIFESDFCLPKQNAMNTGILYKFVS